MWVYPPMHDSVRVAARLREEINRFVTLLKEEEERQSHRWERNQKKIDEALTVQEKQRARDHWAHECQEDRLVRVRLEASLDEHRRLLQWLTGELWT